MVLVKIEQDVFSATSSPSVVARGEKFRSL